MRPTIAPIYAFGISRVPLVFPAHPARGGGGGSCGDGSSKFVLECADFLIEIFVIVSEAFDGQCSGVNCFFLLGGGVDKLLEDRLLIGRGVGNVVEVVVHAIEHS